jgi:hypothetical protein
MDRINLKGFSAREMHYDLTRIEISEANKDESGHKI